MAMLAFQRIVEDAGSCTLCPGMNGRSAVLSERNGSRQPRVMFVAEAPGRQGGDRTRIPMCGDATGRTFETLLASIGLTREEVFITNAVLCNPRSETGANRPPKPAEIRSCSRFLRRTIDLLNPPLVVTLGAKALAALSLIAPHSTTLREGVARRAEWYGRTLIPLYHPSPQVLISRRSLAQQIEDWRAIPAAIR
jgi:DNA polymerase